MKFWDLNQGRRNPEWDGHDAAGVIDAEASDKAGIDDSQPRMGGNGSSDVEIEFGNEAKRSAAIQMAEHAAGLSVQNLAAYMQSSEQIMTAGTGQAIAMLLDPDKSSVGAAALEEIAKFQAALAEFNTLVSNQSINILKKFE